MMAISELKGILKPTSDVKEDWKINNNIIGVFDKEDVLINAIKNIKKNNIKIKNVFTPYPIDEVFHELELKTRFPYIAFIYGACGTILTFAFLYWASVINFPISVGGKPPFSLSFVIIIFVLTIFFGVILSLFSFFIIQKLFPGKNPEIIHEDIMNDKYVIVIESNINNQQSTDKIKELLIANGAIDTAFKNNVENI